MGVEWKGYGRKKRKRKEKEGNERNVAIRKRGIESSDGSSWCQENTVKKVMKEEKMEILKNKKTEKKLENKDEKTCRLQLKTGQEM